MYCIKCGNELAEGSNFCGNCGKKNRFIEEITDNNVFSDDVTTEDLELFIGTKKKQYYILNWLKFRESEDNQYKRYNKTKTWNWAAFFLTFFWLAYRKMYFYAIGTGSVFFILSNILPNEFILTLNVALCGVLGMFGNKIYYDYSQNEILKIKKDTKDLDKQRRAIKMKGGTGKDFVIIFTVVYYGITIIFILIQICNIYPFNQFNSKIISQITSGKLQTGNDTDAINKVGNDVLIAFLKNDYDGSTKNSRVEVRIYKGINFKRLFTECSNIIIAAFKMETMTTGISSNIQYGIDNISMIDSNNAILTYNIKSKVSGQQFEFNSSAVKIDGEWKIDMESFLIGISNDLNDL